MNTLKTFAGARRSCCLALILFAVLAPPAGAEAEKSVIKETIDHIWRDQRRMVTAPLRTSRNDLIVWGGAGASLLLLAPEWGNNQSLDERFEQNINREDQSGTFLRSITHAGDAPILIGASLAGYGVGYWQDSPRIKTASLHVFESLIDTGIVLVVVKVLAGRARPIAEPVDSKFHGPVGYFDNPSENSSFPSGHAAMSFAAATVVSHESANRWVGLSAYTLAATVSYSRIYVEKHWLSDVISGVALGYSVGVLVEKHRHARDEHAGRIVPTVDHNSIGLVWVKEW